VPQALGVVEDPDDERIRGILAEGEKEPVEEVPGSDHGSTPEEEAEGVASEEAKGLFEQPQPDARAEEELALLREEVLDLMREMEGPTWIHPPGADLDESSSESEYFSDLSDFEDGTQSEGEGDGEGEGRRLICDNPAM
jgi:hypothetical protein